MLPRAVRLAEMLDWRSDQEQVSWAGRSFEGLSLESLLARVVCRRLHFRPVREEDRQGRRDHHRRELGHHIAEEEEHRLEDRLGREVDLDPVLEDRPDTNNVLVILLLVQLRSVCKSSANATNISISTVLLLLIRRLLLILRCAVLTGGLILRLV